MEKWIELAKQLGFDTAAPIDVSTLSPMEVFRDTCATNRCGLYATNWACPPGCGTIEECRDILKQYSRGILLQRVGRFEKTIDSKGYFRVKQEFADNYRIMVDAIFKEEPDALFLGVGACDRCEKCTYPEPCRFPRIKYSAIESYGIFVTKICKDNGIRYNYGPRTIAYNGCILFR